jgi:acyl-CoA synthetase (AMP-forming)/AMP-acid ligase II
MPGELEFATRAVAASLVSMEVGSGDRVLLRATPSLRTAIIALGVLRAGLVLVPVSPELSDRELAHVISEVRPVACAADSRDAMRSMLEISPSLLSLETTESTQHPGWWGLDIAQPADPALILFTSGTTGAPKGAVHSHASLLANADALAQAWQWGTDDRLVHALPLFHAHGLCVGLLASLTIGASVVLLPRFGPAEVIEAARRHRGSMFFGVPTMYHRFVTAGMADRLGALRLCVCGSAPLAVRLSDAVAAAGGGRILERYGTTETLMNLSNPYEGERRAGTVGLPLPRVEVRIGAAVSTPAAVAGAAIGYAERSAEGEGELFVRGPTAFSGYWGRPEETEQAFVDGWYATGDIASADSDGYTRILGRSKELIISGGFNVYPAEVESVLADHPFVAEVAVAGTPSDEWGEVVTAYVVPAPGAPGDPELSRTLQDHAAERLAPYKRPRLLRTVKELPRNSMGKVVRRLLGQ